jgi:hypothetical protein
VITNNSFLLIPQSLHFNNNPHLTWELQKTLNQTRKKGGHEGVPSINHFKDSWKLMILLISHLWVAFVELFFPIHVIPCHLHPFPIHALGGANEGLQIFIFFDTSIDIAWDASNAPRLYAQKGFHT